jgi:hypothetical protein
MAASNLAATAQLSLLKNRSDPAISSHLQCAGTAPTTTRNSPDGRIASKKITWETAYAKATDRRNHQAQCRTGTLPAV